jgi:hypothetical protein
MKNFLQTILLLFITSQAFCQNKTTDGSTNKQKHLNVYVISKSEKFEFLPFTVKIRAIAKSIFSNKRMRVIVAPSSEFAAAKIEKLMTKHHAVIGNLWFDSHGLYKNGFSSFTIGQDNFNYKNINDSNHTAFLQKIAGYTDDKTKVGIGSCYGGATFIHPGSATVKSGPMNGDSLMIGMGKIFNGATIYASGGWVMMKPGIFSDNFGFAGYPLGKRYRTEYWRPVWDHLGEWYSYTSKEGFIRNINTVALTRIGEIKVRERNYLSLSKAIKKQGKAIASLQP